MQIRYLCRLLTLSNIVNLSLLPAVQASIPANTWVVSGVPQTKSEWIIYFSTSACLIISQVPYFCLCSSTDT